MQKTSYSRHRFPPHIIPLAVWIYTRFTMGYWDVEDLLPESGLDIVSRELQGMGYSVEAEMFTAFEVGAWHERNRLFIVAHANGNQQHQHTASDNITGQCKDGEARGIHAQLERSIDILDTSLVNHDSDKSKGSEVPLFAPAPGDFEAWTQVLGKHPEYQPALRRDDDGMAQQSVTGFAHWLQRMRGELSKLV